MTFPLKNFEAHVEEKILYRGRDYFQQGSVYRCIELERGKYEFKVSGSYPYTVTVQVQKEEIVGHRCTCPFDMGPICKHVVASLFYLRDKLDTLIDLDDPIYEYHESERPLAEQLQEMLDQISHQELKDFLMDKALYDDMFRDKFLASFAHLNKHESKRMYADQVSSILSAASDRDGYINWSSTYNVSSGVDDLLSEARKHLTTKNYKSAFWIVTVVMEKMTEALQYADDSGGDIYGCIDEAYDLLKAIAKDDLDETWRKEILDYCFYAFESGIYQEWEMHLNMLKLASRLVKTQEETDHLFSLMDRPQSSVYDMEDVQVLKYELLLKVKDATAANAYLEENMGNVKLRRIAIRKALDAKDFERAKAIVKDAMESEEHKSKGFSKEWHDWLLIIAQEQGDTEDILTYARLIYINGNHHKKDYYDLLKKHIGPSKWEGFVRGLIKDIRKDGYRADNGFLADVYIEEKWWDELMQLIKDSERFHVLLSYERYLPARFSEDIIVMYAIHIVNYLDDRMGRKHYETVCSYIERMMQLGGEREAQEIITILSNKYPSRRALLEELGKLNP